MTILRFLPLFAILLPASAESARILFFAPSASRSMIFPFMPALDEMAKRGHEIHLATSYSVPLLTKDQLSREKMHAITTNENIFEAYTNKMLEMQLSQELGFIDMLMTEQGSKTLEIMTEANDIILSVPEMKRLLFDPSTRFDIVITVYMCNEVGHYLAHRFNASLVHYFPMQVSHSLLDTAMGQPFNPAYSPNYVMEALHPMDFVDRLKSTLHALTLPTLTHLFVRKGMEAVLDKHFPGEDRPSLSTLEKQAALAFSSGHPILMDGARAVNPNYIYTGFMHCRDPKPLPKDLKKFMDSGQEHGVVLIAFGSMITASASLSEAKATILFNTLRKLKQKVLMKWETEDYPGKPDNVKLVKWVPQQDILGHENTILFINHAGMGSLQEAIYHRKPVITTPITVDQFGNGKDVERLGYGINIQYHSLNEANLQEAIEKVINDPQYKQRAHQLGSFIREHESSPVNRTVWWLEHLAKHPGLPLLRSPVHQLTWYQRNLLDVTLFIFVILGILLFIMYYIFKCLLCCCKHCWPVSKEKKQ